MVETQREGAWIVYSLPAAPTPELTANMKCLQDCCREKSVFKSDMRRMKGSLARCSSPLANCCKPSRASSRTKTKRGASR
jgi:ArsR family transcriptional regulator